MRTRFTRIEADGFRSLRGVVLHPEPLEVLLDAEGTATRDLIALFTLLRELAHGRLQQHLSQPGVTDGLRSPVKLSLAVDWNTYRVELQRFPDGVWRLVEETLDLLAGVAAELIAPGQKQPPAEEALLPSYADLPPAKEPEARGTDEEEEGRMVGGIVQWGMTMIAGLLRGFRVQPAGAFDLDEATFLVLEEHDVDLPANAVWDRVQSARAASLRVPVLLFTRSVALADAFDLQDVQRLETTADGATSFRPLQARKERNA
ncbi:hypothetical protein OV208_05120 [Corallococcus sp. bb12-1]|uniref:hypothetical protein n=1 Tax=Corallococcus sp. bb12-1 TaxID=2996784 RepID=UPI00227143FC|nr:hypothetical protein [Corallococcus sp. bb12-1]MCY1040696.1 hypothetical protein [Corallococcus sp. bb12-1]